MEAMANKSMGFARGHAPSTPPPKFRHEVETETSSSLPEDSGMVEEGDQGCADKCLQCSKDARGCFYCSHGCFMVHYRRRAPEV